MKDYSSGGRGRGRSWCAAAAFGAAWLLVGPQAWATEPTPPVEIVTPEEFLGDVMGDITRRRGHLQGTELRGNAQVVRAEVPLAEMFGYATDLRSMTQGRATYTMEFSHYQPVTKDVEAGVLARARG